MVARNTTTKNGRFKDLTGQRFGMLTAIRVGQHSTVGALRWLCLCDCGKEYLVLSGALIRGRTKNCGCIKRVGYYRNGRPSHGMTDTQEYWIWRYMIRRCEVPTASSYERYGGRGIKVDPEWRKDFMAFFNHVGKRPSPQHSIDRINNDGNYEPGNVRWATHSEQASNRSGCVFLTVGDKTATLAEWSKLTGIHHSTLRNRLANGWPPEKIVGRQ